MMFSTDANEDENPEYRQDQVGTSSSHNDATSLNRSQSASGNTRARSLREPLPANLAALQKSALDPLEQENNL